MVLPRNCNFEWSAKTNLCFGQRQGPLGKAFIKLEKFKGSSFSLLYIPFSRQCQPWMRKVAVPEGWWINTVLPRSCGVLWTKHTLAASLFSSLRQRVSLWGCCAVVALGELGQRGTRGRGGKGRLEEAEGWHWAWGPRLRDSGFRGSVCDEWGGELLAETREHSQHHSNLPVFRSKPPVTSGSKGLKDGHVLPHPATC